MSHALGYLVAIVAAVILAPLVGMILFVFSIPLVKPFRPLGRLSLIYCFAKDSASMCLAMVLFIWVATQLDVKPAFLMFLLTSLGVMSNDFRRIDAAKEARFLSGLGQFMARHTDDIDHRGRVWGEYGSLAGDMVGIWAPAMMLVRNMDLW